MACVLAVIGPAILLVGCGRKIDIDATDPEHRQLSESPRIGGQIGGMVSVFAPAINLGPQRAEARPFLRTGLLGDFASEQDISFQNFGGATANGTTTVSRSLTVPVMVGVSVPAKSLGVNVPGLTAEIFGGAQVTRRKASLFLTEALAPAGPPTSVTNSWTSIDPAVGAALMYEVGRFGGRPVSVGPSVTVDWTRSHDVSVISSNFPATELYTLSTGRRTETTLRLNVTVGLDSMVSAGASGGLTW